MARALDITALKMPVFLAPMAGITDLPFRTLVSRFGAGLVVSEMIASGEFLTGRPGTHAKAELGAGIEGSSVQLAGREAGAMAEAARRVAGMGARIIDINMGCPAKKVTGGLSGSALMRDLDHALRLIDAVVGAVDVPVTLKTRLGWDGACLNAADLARRAEAAGVAMIVVHGRTRAQFYRGQADWAAIRPIVDAVAIPVIANGDIRSAAEARRALALSGAAGVMLGRGAQGRPWALAEIAHALGHAPAPDVPRGGRLVDLMLGHHEAMLSFYGPDLGMRVARKHLGWYLDQVAVAPDVRRQVLTCRDAAALPGLLARAMASDIGATTGADGASGAMPQGRAA